MLCSSGIRGRQNVENLGAVVVCVCVCVRACALVCLFWSGCLYDTQAAVLGTQLIHFLNRGIDNSGRN